MKIFIASDHAGFELKQHLVGYLQENGFDVADLGPLKFDPNDDYPDFISLVGAAVSKNPTEDRGIVIGLSGQGEMMVANKFPNVRAGLFYGVPAVSMSLAATGNTHFDPDEILKLLRQHNDANVLSLGAKFLSTEEAEHAVEVWIEISFSNEPRHARRIEKIRDIEKAAK